MGRPVLLPEPEAPVDVPGQSIVLQPVALLRREPGETGLQAAEEILGLKASTMKIAEPFSAMDLMTLLWITNN